MSQSNDRGLNLDRLEALPSLPRAHKLIGRNLDSLECLYSETQMREYAHVARRAALANQPAPTVPAGSRERFETWVRKELKMPDHEKIGPRGIAALGAWEAWQAALAHQPAQEQAEPWHDAVLAECMRIEAAYHADDPARTLKELIDWYANSSDIAVTNKKLADNYLALTCASIAHQEPVAAPQEAAAPNREEVLEEAALACEEQHHKWRWDNEADSASGPRDCAAAIRALKRAAQLDGGQEGSDHA